MGGHCLTRSPQANGRFVWRVDWRLRPDPSVNPLALSVSAGLDYYFSHAAAWERLALAKARVAAAIALLVKISLGTQPLYLATQFGL